MRSIEDAGKKRPSGKGLFLVGDTETKGLLHQLRRLPQDMHVIVLKDFKTHEAYIFFDPPELREPSVKIEFDGHQDGYLADAVQFMAEAEAVAYHNFFGYDYPALTRTLGEPVKGLKVWAERAEGSELYGIFPFKFMDTYVLSTLLNPDRKLPGQAYGLGLGNTGPHSIASHGIRINRYKPENEDWSVLTDHMIHRCSEDTSIGMDYLEYLMRGEWDEAIQRKHALTGLDIRSALRMEQRLGYEMAMQADRGFRLDIKWCIDTYEELHREIAATEAGFRPHMPQRMCRKPRTMSDWIKTVQEMRTWIEDNQADLTAQHAWWLGQTNESHAHRYSKCNRGGDLTTVWEIYTKSGDVKAAVRKIFPEMAGNKHDIRDPLVVGPFSPVRYEDIPLGNRESVKQILHEYGWLGLNYNDTELEHIEEHGEPPSPWSGKIDEDSMEAWLKRDPNVPEWCRGIARWYILNSRANQLLNKKDMDYYHERGVWPKGGLRGLIGAASCKDTHGLTAARFYELFERWPTDPEHDGQWSVPAICIPIATNTFRARHKVVVNIPARGLYPLRRAFIARKGKKILGIDGAGLELRMLSHFLNDKDYEQVILSGDIHSHNQMLAGLETRDMAKTFVYAVLYGSGVANLARSLGISVNQARAAMDQFLDGLPALKNLMQRLEAAATATGYVQAFDGRWGRIRRRDGKLATHTVLNVLLQMTGSLCMKWALYDAIEEAEQLFADGIPLLAFVHDEYQFEVDEERVEYRTYQVSGADAKAAWKAEEKVTYLDEQGRQWSAPVKGEWDEEAKLLTCTRMFHPLGDLMAKRMTSSGERMRIRTPLAGEYKIGGSWADTH